METVNSPARCAAQKSVHNRATEKKHAQINKVTSKLSSRPPCPRRRAEKTMCSITADESRDTTERYRQDGVDLPSVSYIGHTRLAAVSRMHEVHVNSNKIMLLPKAVS